MEPIQKFVRRGPLDHAEEMLLRAIVYLSRRGRVSLPALRSYMEEQGIALGRTELPETLGQLKRGALVTGELHNSTVKATIQGKLLHDSLGEES